MYLEGYLQFIGRTGFHECLRAEDDDEVGSERRPHLRGRRQRCFTDDILRVIRRNLWQRDVSKDKIREGGHGGELRGDRESQRESRSGCSGKNQQSRTRRVFCCSAMPGRFTECTHVDL